MDIAKEMTREQGVEYAGFMKAIEADRALADPGKGLVDPLCPPPSSCFPHTSFPLISSHGLIFPLACHDL